MVRGAFGARNTFASRSLIVYYALPSCQSFDSYPYPRILIFCALLLQPIHPPSSIWRAALQRFLESGQELASSESSAATSCGRFSKPPPRQKSSNSAYLICPRWCICQAKNRRATEREMFLTVPFKRISQFRPNPKDSPKNCFLCLLLALTPLCSFSASKRGSRPCVVLTVRTAKQKCSELGAFAAKHIATVGASFVKLDLGHRKSPYVGKA
jgi:hypothetical protein